jgi:hypothetical protein
LADGPILNTTLAASGGGASSAFTKPVWQVGTGVPSDNARDVPDVSVTASANHDGYLIFCSNTSDGCPSGGGEVVVGGTSAATPVFSSILILLNHYLVKNGIQSTPGLSNVNPMLYQLANSSSPFHDITAGTNIVPCTNPSPNCPTSAPFQFGYSAGSGYDQVTGLGSVDAYNFVIAWANFVRTQTTTTLAISPQATITAGTSVTLTASITPAPPNGETVTFTDTASGSTLGTATTASGKAVFTSTTIPGGSYTVVASYPGDTTLAASASTPAQSLNVQDFTLSPSTLSIIVSTPGQSASGTITFNLLGGLTQAPSFSCSGLPSQSTCTFLAASASTETVTIGTTAASWLHDRPFAPRNGILYALLLPGLIGLVLPASRRRWRLSATLVVVGVLAALTLWMPACGGGGAGGGNHNPGTPVGQTNVTVTATESGISHNITINLNVQ